MLVLRELIVDPLEDSEEKRGGHNLLFRFLSEQALALAARIGLLIF